MLIFHFCWHTENWRSKLLADRKFEFFLYDAYLQNGGHFSIFFIMADTYIPFLLTLRKQKKKTLDGLVIWHFSVWSILTKWWPFFKFFHNGQHWYSISQVQIFHWFSFPITKKLHPLFSFNSQVLWCSYVSWYFLATFLLAFLTNHSPIPWIMQMADPGPPFTLAMATGWYQSHWHPPHMCTA